MIESRFEQRSEVLLCRRAELLAVENISMEGKNIGLAKVSSSRDVSVNGGRRWRSG